MRTNKLVPCLIIFVLQDFENLVHENKPFGIPPNPGTVHQFVYGTNQPHHNLNISLLEEVDYVFPKETKDFQRQ